MRELNSQEKVLAKYPDAECEQTFDIDSQRPNGWCVSALMWDDALECQVRKVWIAPTELLAWDHAAIRIEATDGTR